MTFDRVVVGLDGSDYGFEALRQGLVLRAPDAPLVALTVLDAVTDRLPPVEPDPALKLLRRIQEHSSALLRGHPSCEAWVVRGEVLPTLLEHARREDASLIAVGAQQHGRLVGALLGSTATGVLHDAQCSVLLARPRLGERWSPRRIVVGVDGSEPSLAALETADELAARLGSSVTVLTGTSGKQVVRTEPLSARVDEWVPSHPVAVLVEQSVDADLVVVGSRGLHGIRSLGSVSERVAHRAHCSVLVVRPGNRVAAPAEETTVAACGRDAQ